MSTFYLQGCDSENHALEYFDSIYLPVQELIDLDTKVQEELFEQLVSEDELDTIDLDAIDDMPSTIKLESLITNLKVFVNEQLLKSEDIEVIVGEENLKYSYQHLLNTYLDEISNTWPQLISIINSNDISDDDMEHFNQLLQQAQYNLDKSLNQFYDIAEIYAGKHNIEIEKIL